MLRKLLFAIILSGLFSGLSAQYLLGKIDIANQPNVDERDPYLTYYWYDYYFDNCPAPSSKQNLSPLWLTYIESDTSGNQRVVAKNVDVDWDHNLSISEKMTISDTLNLLDKRNPIIENCFRKPLAIWEEGPLNQAQLKFAVLNDSNWTAPQIMFPGFANQHSAVFYTHDYSGWGQSDSLNRLVFASGNTILTSMFNPDYSLQPPDTIYQSPAEIEHIHARKNLNDDFWLVCDEVFTSDSILTHCFVLQKDSTDWQGPFTVLTLQEKPSTNLNLSMDFWNDERIHLSWLEQDKLFEQSIYLQNNQVEQCDTIEISSYPQMATVNYVSNTLLPGGCVVAPVPGYFANQQQDSISYLAYGISIWGLDQFYQTTTFNHEMAISGLHNLHYFIVWGKDTLGQKDLEMGYSYISVGAISDKQNTLIHTIKLLQNYPNPFNPETNIRFQLPRTENVKLEIYNLTGQKVRTLFAGNKPAGEHSLCWNGRDDVGNSVASGVYVYRLTVGKFAESKKMLLIR